MCFRVTMLGQYQINKQTNKLSLNQQKAYLSATCIKKFSFPQPLNLRGLKVYK